MKCVRYYRPFGGHIERLSDEEAAQKVRYGLAMYCPKRLWKVAKNAPPSSSWLVTGISMWVD